MNNTDLDRAQDENEAERRLQVAVEDARIQEAERTMQDLSASTQTRQSARDDWRDATARRDDLRNSL